MHEKMNPMRFSLYAGLVLIVLSVISSCGGGGGGNATITDDDSFSSITVSGNVTGTVPVTPESGSGRVVSNSSRTAGASVSGMTVSITGCSTTGTTGVDGSFSFSVPAICSGSNLIITAASVDGSFISKKITRVSSTSISTADDMGVEDTLAALVVEASAQQKKEVNGDASIKDTLASLSSENITEIKNSFDADEDGQLELQDIDTDNDGDIDASEMSALTVKAQAEALGSIPELEPVMNYHTMLLDGISLSSSNIADDARCTFDMGTPDDVSDDLYCGAYYGVSGLMSHLFMFIEDDEATFSDIEIRKTDESTIVYKEHVRLVGSGEICGYRDRETKVDNDITLTLKNVDGTWKISSEKWATGRLSASLETDKNNYTASESIITTASIKNEGPAHMVSCFQLYNFRNFAVTRPDNKAIFNIETDIITCGHPCRGFAPGEGFTITENIRYGEHATDRTIWGDDSYDWSDDAERFFLDVPGEYELYFYHSMFNSECYRSNEPIPDKCIKTGPVKFTITE